MAFVAWLFLAATPVLGISAEVAGMIAQADHATSSHRSAQHCDDALSTGDPSNCESCDDDSCSEDDCGTTFSSAMGLPITRELTDASVASVRWSLQDAAVPSSVSTPPLRPPAA